MTHLRGSRGPSKKQTEKLDFSAHLRRVKEYSAFTDFIKNQSIGVS